MPTGADVDAFLAGVADPRRRADAEAVCRLMAEVTGAAPEMWGSAIVGFCSLCQLVLCGGTPRRNSAVALQIYLLERAT